MRPYSRRRESEPWFSVGEQLDGASAHRRVKASRDGESGGSRPYCVYVHVPFCASICRFCALYTFGVSANADDVSSTYVDVVRRSLDTHPWAGSPHPPTTVHFGGGTPLILGAERFAVLVHALRDAFGTSPACEWAVETTTSSLDPETVDALEALECRRVHLGIQTLDDQTRVRIGRRETGATALARIRALEARGFLASVDLIVGFEGIDASGVESDLYRLYEAGVRMFSVCELRERRLVRLGIRDEEERARRNYAVWRTIWAFMERVGLVPIHLGQFGRTQADNLYFTHPARGEDCVAIGPYAHGSADELCYGNRLLPDYYDAILGGETPIAMGIDYRAGEQIIREVERELLAHQVSKRTLDRVGQAYPDTFPPILDRWLAQALLDETHPHVDFRLTADGSWFVGNMIEDVRRMAETSSAHARAVEARMVTGRV
jgi:anaerobilin synthase